MIQNSTFFLLDMRYFSFLNLKLALASMRGKVKKCWNVESKELSKSWTRVEQELSKSWRKLYEIHISNSFNVSPACVYQCITRLFYAYASFCNIRVFLWRILAWFVIFLRKHGGAVVRFFCKIWFLWRFIMARRFRQLKVLSGSWYHVSAEL